MTALIAGVRSGQLAQRFDVGQVLGSTGGTLVLNEGFSADDPNSTAIDLEESRILDRFVEGNTIDLRNQINAHRGHPQLHDLTRFVEVVGGETQLCERCAKGRERIEDMGGVAGVWANQDVEILGGSGLTVERDCVSTDDDEIGAGVCESDQHIPEIIEQFDHGRRSSRRTQGISDLG